MTQHPAQMREIARASCTPGRVFWLSVFGICALSLLLVSIGTGGVAWGVTGGGHIVYAQEERAPSIDASHPSGHAAVQYLFPEQLSLIAGMQTTADLHFRVGAGLHVNSHKPYEKNLVPTNLVVVEGPGVRVTGVDFPAGQDFAFTFAPTEKISVYSGEFILHARITAERGDHLLQGALRYQACDASTCFPPKTIPVAIDIIAK
jgi:Disulphide bond corrector protein DsbC